MIITHLKKGKRCDRERQTAGNFPAPGLDCRRVRRRKAPPGRRPTGSKVVCGSEEQSRGAESAGEEAGAALELCVE